MSRKNIFSDLFNVEYDIQADKNYMLNLMKIGTQDRIPFDHFKNRIEVNTAFQNELIPRILAEFSDQFTRKELESLNSEDLLEIAGAAVNKSITLTLEKGRDASDNSDFKATSSKARNNIKQEKKNGVPTGMGVWTNSYQISGVGEKIGTVRVMAYNKYTKQFDYWAIPHQAYKGLDKIEIPIERYRTSIGDAPKFTGRPNYTTSKWDQWRCESFEEMAIKLP
jgi:hypothetical protein